jgi:FAD/FMN-containing dehydrogenase
MCSPGESAVDVMRAPKHAPDPENLLNSGKILPPAGASVAS